MYVTQSRSLEINDELIITEVTGKFQEQLELIKIFKVMDDEMGNKNKAYKN